MPGTVLYERDGHVATITYNRPEALNAVDAELRADLNAAWTTFRDDEEAWVAIVTGAGRAFCAGADLRRGGAGDAVEHSFWEIPGLTFASERAEFGFPEVRLGVPTIQGAVRMPRTIGWQAAMELLLVGERVDADTAREMGLVRRVVPHDRLMDEARALAERLCRSAPLAVRATKEVARRGLQMPFADAIRFGETMRRVAGATEDAREGIAAAQERRTPAWRGR
jgi:enoyl-CoA hydratase/carnithine racemase